MYDPTRIGLLWQDVPAQKKGGPRVRGPIPEIPHTGWTPPTEFPNLSNAKVIGVDTETWDPELEKAGPGWARGKGHIIGASISVEDGSSWYFPIRHGIEKDKQVLPPDHAAMNMNPDHVLRWLNHTLSGHQPKVGANLIYDVGWLNWEGVTINGMLYDVQFAEALLDSETPRVALEDLGQKYLGLGKESSILYDWLAQWCGGTPNERQRKWLYLSPPNLAGPYAEADASLPITILQHQWPKLIERGAMDLFHMECRLIRLLVAMRMKGAPVDIPKAEAFYDELGGDLDATQGRLKQIAGQPVNPNAQDSLKSAFKRLGLTIPTRIDKKTGETKTTFAAPYLELLDHPLVETILEHKRTEKVRNTFVKGYILDKNVNGRLHCSFHPLKGLTNGARSGRFASSGPNLQNIPTRTEIGRRVRECFVSLCGAWLKADYSQIEYRMLAHHAVGEGSAELRKAYNDNPLIDYHELTSQLVERLTGLHLPRRNIKNINFGLIYGMAEDKLARDLGLSPAAGKDLFKNYHTGAPFARATMEQASKEINQFGYVETIMHRRSDFNRWEKKGWSKGGRAPALSYELAIRKWGAYNIERAKKHKGLNRKLQGGAADVMKRAMVSAYEAGLFEDDACGMPMLTVHDELDFDFDGDLTRPCWKEFKHVMENSMPELSVPVILDMDTGPNWGQIE